VSELGKTQSLTADPNRTMMGVAPTLNATQTIKPIQCPICKSHNPAGVMFCVECGLIFDRALPDDAFGAPVVRLPVLVEGGGREHTLRLGENIVGREADVMLADSKVSRKHARIVLGEGEITLEDLGSTNGTTVNGEKLPPGESRSMQQGDCVAFGGFELTLSVPGKMGATAAMTPQAAPSSEPEPAASPSTELEAAIALFVGDDSRPLPEGTYTFGRREGNDIVVADPYVSGSHGQIEVESDGVFVTDLESTNGTVLDGDPLAPHSRTAWRAGTILKIGSVEIRFERSGPRDGENE